MNDEPIANPDEAVDINELFHRDPMELTDTDIDKIIAEYRRKRQLFNTNPAAVKAKRAPAKQSPAQKAASGLNLDIDLKL